MHSERFGFGCAALIAAMVMSGCGHAAPPSQVKAAGGASPSAKAADDASSSGSKTPATLDQAKKVLDLRDLPLAPGSEDPGARSVARLTYNATKPAPEAYAFHQKELAQRGWRETPGGYQSDEMASGTFVRDGYTLSMSASKVGDETMVSLTNHGNLDARTLPQPAAATVLYEAPVSIAYVTRAPVASVAKQVEEALVAAGWKPYGSAGDSRYYKQNAIRLLATTSTAPAQGGKTVVSYQTELLSADLPAPADAKQLQYSEPPTQLSVDFPGDLTASDKWYREHLGKLGWKPTTEQPVKDDFTYFVIYRNEAGEMLEITFRKIEAEEDEAAGESAETDETTALTRLMLRFTTAEEFAAMEKRWEEQRRKAAKESRE